MVQARADVWVEASMCSAIARRMWETGTISSPMPALGAGIGCAGAVTGAVAPAGAGATCPPDEMTAITSAFALRPPLPVPAICARSRSCAFASRRTSGERICERGPRSGTVATAAAGAGAIGAAAAGAGGAAGGAADDPSEEAAPPDGSGADPVVGAAPEAGEEAASPEAVASPEAAPSPEAAAPASEISISAVPTGTVAPSSTRILVTVPATGEGTSVSTLSVEISNSGSSRATASPSRLSHFRIVPSTIVSPSCGIWIDVTSSSSPAGQPVDGRLDVGDLRQERVLQWWGERDRDVGRS